MALNAMRSFVAIRCATEGTFDQFANGPPNIPNYDLCIVESKLAGPYSAPLYVSTGGPRYRYDR